MSKELREAARTLLDNAFDRGECFVDEPDLGEIDDYPEDKEGNLWYQDYWDLNEALSKPDPLQQIALILPPKNSDLGCWLVGDLINAIESIEQVLTSNGYALRESQDE